MLIFVKVTQVPDSWRVKININSEPDNLLVYVHGVLENASNFLVVGVDGDFKLWSSSPSITCCSKVSRRAL